MNLRQRNTISTSGNMSSMTDLVFLMLIFFILLATQVSSGLKVELPKADGAKGISSSVSVGIKEDSTFYLGTTEVKKEELPQLLSARFSDMPKEKQVIVLKADRNAPTGETIWVIGMAKQNKWKIVVQAKSL